MAVVEVAFSDLNTWLQNQPENTVDTPYKLKITSLSASDVTFDGSSPIPLGSASPLGEILKANNTKYVDLSETVFPDVTNLLYTFFECSSLIYAPNIPQNVTILSVTFSGCLNLKEAPSLPNNVIEMYSAFQLCQSITSANIPDNVSIASFAFNQCTALEDIYINGSIETANRCFQGCTNLFTFHTGTWQNAVTVRNWLKTIKTANANNFPNNLSQCSFVYDGQPEFPCEVAFSELDDFLGVMPANTPSTAYELIVTGLTAEDIVDPLTFKGLGITLKRNETKFVDLSHTQIPNTVTDMTNCFTSCTSLTSAPVIPDSVVNMKKCFQWCSSLTSAPVLPRSVTNLSGTFAVTPLTEAPAIPEGVTDMSDCFIGTKLTSAPVLPSTVTNLRACFQDIDTLVQPPIIPNGVTNMQQCFAGCTSLEIAPNIPNTVTNIRGCFTDTAITQAPIIPNSVTAMSSCFDGCASLTNTPNIPEGITDLGFCFRDCVLITSIPDIPASVTNLTRTFEGCTGLTSTDKITDSVMAIQTYSNVFKGCTNLKSFSSEAPWMVKKWLTDIQTESNDNFPNNIAECTFTCTAEPPYEIAFSELNDALGMLSANTKDTAYSINVTGLTAGDIYPSDQSYTIGNVLNNNPTKYVNLETTVLPLPSQNQLSDAFGDCNTLIKPPVIPNGVTEMSGTFMRCKNLVEAPVIPDGVTKLTAVFSSCESLREAPIIPNAVTNMKSCFGGCKSLINAPTLPPNLVDMYATFVQCSNLEYVPNIPQGVTIMFSSFASCVKLKKINNVPSSVIDLASCFANCSSLEEITDFKADLQSLVTNNKAKRSFSGCTSLARIGLNSVPAETDDWHAFRLNIGASTVEGKVYDKDGVGTVIASTNINKSNLKLPVKTDELWFPSGYTDAEIDAIIEKAIQYKYTYFNNSNVIPPDEKTFVIWADNENHVRSNLPALNPVDIVQSGNMNPVTSNAVVPTDVVAVGNMQSVESDAVAKCLRYSTDEVDTGKIWTDGSKIYRKVYFYRNVSLGSNSQKVDDYFIAQNKIVSMSATLASSSGWKSIPFFLYVVGDDLYIGQNITDSTTVTATVIVEYNK